MGLLRRLNVNPNSYVENSKLVISVRSKSLINKLKKDVDTLFRKVEDLNREILIEVIEGYLDSDGNIERRRGSYFCVALATVNRNIAEMLVKMCKTLGFKHGIYRDIKGRKRIRYSVFIFNHIHMLSNSVKVMREIRAKGAVARAKAPHP